MAKGKLTPRQEKFAREFAACGNGAEAARRAGYSVLRASVAAAELVANRKVSERLDELRSKDLARVDDIGERIKKEADLLAFAATEEIGARDKVAALTLSAKLRGLLRDKVDHTHRISLEALVAGEVADGE